MLNIRFPPDNEEAIAIRIGTLFKTTPGIATRSKDATRGLSVSTCKSCGASGCGQVLFQARSLGVEPDSVPWSMRLNRLFLGREVIGCMFP